MNRHHHNGQTIVSLMVGLLISLIVVVSMLALYKILIDISNSASSVAAREGQVSSGFLAAESMLQEAGFGIAADELLGGRIKVKDGGRTVVWVYRQIPSSSTIYCGGLSRRTDGEEPTRKHGLYALIPLVVDCTTGGVDAATWSTTNSYPLATRKAFYDPDDTAAGTEQGAYALDGYVFELASGNCWPYGQQSGTPTSHPQVNFVFQNDTLFTACLSNLPSP